MQSPNQSKIDSLVNISLICAVVGFIFGPLSLLFLNIPLPLEFFYFGFVLSVAAFLTGAAAVIVFWAAKGRERLRLIWRIDLVLSLAASIFYLILLVILLSLFPHPNTYRNIVIKSNVRGTAFAAKLWHDDASGGNGTYNRVCASLDFQRLSSVIEDKGSTLKCFSSQDSFCAKARLVISKKEWCADSTGYEGFAVNCSAEYISCR